MMFGFPVGGIGKPNHGTQNNPVLDLNFAQTGALDSRITFTRNSTATYFNSSGVLTSASANTPRFDYDPVTLAARGLLIEEQRTNSFNYSEQFDNAYWTTYGTTVSANSAVAPSGETVADLIVEAATTAEHGIYRNAVIASGFTAATLSVYAKASGRNFLIVSLKVAGADNRTWFNLATGAVATNAAGSTASITSIGNGWYRCAVTRTFSGSESAGATFALSNADNTLSYTGNGTSGVYIWGAQLEAGAFATSYIPTTTAQATRIADSAVMTGTNFSSWYNATEGTFFADVGSANGNGARAITFSDGTINNQAWLRQANAASSALEVYTSGGFVAQIGVVVAQPIKSAGTLKTNDFAVSVNGGVAATDTAGAVGSYTQANIAANYNASASFLNGHIRRIAYYPRRLSNAELQGITT